MVIILHTTPPRVNRVYANEVFRSEVGGTIRRISTPLRPPMYCEAFFLKSGDDAGKLHLSIEKNILIIKRHFSIKTFPFYLPNQCQRTPSWFRVKGDGTEDRVRQGDSHVVRSLKEVPQASRRR